MVQELFFEIIRQKQHIFIDAKDNVQVLELKKIVEGITKVPVNDMTLVKFRDEGDFGNFVSLDDRKLLSECGFSAQNAKAQSPASIGLIYRGECSPCVEELSAPPPIPDQMRNETNQRDD